jgi:hypothetical protein
MSMQHSSRSAIVISTIKGKVASFFGYTLAVPVGLVLIFEPATDAGTNITSLIVIGFGVLLIYYGIKIKKRLRRFKNYIQIITTENTTSLKSIAGKTSQSVDFVMKDIKEMTYKKYFVDAYIDENAYEIVLKNRENNVNSVQVENNIASEMITVTCKGCGAANSVSVGKSNECEFCGSNLSA